MDINELQLLVKEGEGLTVEFKERFSSKIDKDMVAFANTSGGRILLGVDDAGKVIGERLTNDFKAKINSLARNCEPAVPLKEIKQVGNVVVVTIDGSDEKPHSCSSGYFRRLDAATQKMNQKELKLLFKKFDNAPPYEQVTCEKISFSDLSTDKIKQFLLEANIALNNIKPKELLNSLNLANGNAVNNAGVLFFANNPRHYIFHCEMILAAFKGTDRVHIYDRMDVQDDLITQFNQAMIFIRKHLNVRSEIKGINRRDICEIPLEALREAVANAIIHRDYSMPGTSLMVEIFEDRVVVKNPGGLPNGMGMEQLMNTSVRRNELVADIFSRVDKAERMASGLPRIMRLLSEADLAEPVIKSNSFFEIIFKRDKRFTSATEYPADQSKDEHHKTLSARQLKILHLLKNKRLFPREILDALNEDITDRTLRRDLQALKRKGCIDNEGQLGPKTRWFVL